MDSRLTDLEIRHSHSEAAIDELTRTVLRQEREIERLRAELEMVKQVLRDMADPGIAPRSEETPPPHY